MRFVSRSIALLACLLGAGACAPEAESEQAGSGRSPSESVSTVSLALSSGLRVLIFGNSQLGYQSNPGGGQFQQSVVGPVLEELSDKSNVIVGTTGATPMFVQVRNPGGWVACDSNKATFLNLITPSQVDVVIVQPGMNEFNPGPSAATQACWEEFRKKATDNGIEFGMMSTVTAPASYASQLDVTVESAIRTFAAQKGSLFIPAAGIVRSTIGSTLSMAAQTSWYSDTGGHVTSRGHYAYAAALYQFISWRASLGASPLPSQLTKLSQTQAPNASEAFLIQSYAQNAFINRTVALKANGSSNKNLVTAESQGNASLVTRTTALGDWERFSLKNYAGGTLVITAKVNSKYVCAEDGGNQPLIANRTAVGDWEKFYPIRRAGAGANLALQAIANGKYVTFNGNGSTPAIANATSIGDAQKFIGWYP